MLAAKRQDGGLFKGPPYPGYPFIMIPDLTSPYLPNGSLSPTARTVSASAPGPPPAARPPGPACGPCPAPSLLPLPFLPLPLPLPASPPPLVAQQPETLQTFLPFVDWDVFALRHVLAFSLLPRDVGETLLSKQGSARVVVGGEKNQKNFFLFFLLRSDCPRPLWWWCLFLHPGKMTVWLFLFSLSLSLPSLFCGVLGFPRLTPWLPRPE